MSGWTDLNDLGVTVRPVSGIHPPAGNRSSYTFRAGMTSTIRLLARELRSLDAERVVLELDLRERDIRLDGLPRADARTSTPTVALAFESRHGPLRYATCEFVSWEANLRAIALSMEALRAVDRYGVSKRGEQYRGWRAIPQHTSDPADLIYDRDRAVEYLGRWMVPDVDDVDSALRKALFATHPDQGGDPLEFRKVVRARELLAS